MAAQMAYINKVIMTGQLVRDPEYRHTTTGAPVSNFRIASTKRYRDTEGNTKEEVCYIGVAAWHILADSCRDRLHKGSPVQVEGELKSRVRDAGNGVRRSFVEIRAYHIKMFHDDGSQEDLAESPIVPFAAPAPVPVAAGMAPTDRMTNRQVRGEVDESPFRIVESATDGYEPFTSNDTDEL